MGRVLLLAIVLVYSLAPNPRPVSQVGKALVTEIKGAIVRGRPEQVLQLLRDNGLGVNSQLTDARETVLHLTAELGKMPLAEQFLVHGARVNERDVLGETPLAYAQKGEHADLVELLQVYAEAELALLQQAKTSDAQDLFAAADNDDRPGAELLLAEGADPKEKRHHGESTDSRKLDFKTPFHIAVEAENYTLAAILLRAAQGINGLDEQGWTPLMVAILAQDWNLVREFIRDGADLLAGHKENALDVAQMMASEEKFVDVFVEERGVNGVVHTDGATASLISLASKYGYKRVFDVLTARGADLGDVEVEIADDVFIGAVKNGITEDVAWLLDRGADIEAKDNLGRTALRHAAQGGHTETAALLLDRGADIEDKGIGGGTALLYAAQGGHTETAALLLDRGADTEAKDYYGWTALHYAAQRGDTETAALLLDRGADIEAKDKVGRTALQLAAWVGHTETAALLRERGARQKNARPMRLISR